MLFWHVGNQILTQTLQNKRADYGKQIVVTLSRELVERFGNNFEDRNLRRMIQFAEQYSDLEKVVTLSRVLSWSHFLTLIPIKDVEARDFYGKVSITVHNTSTSCGWSNPTCTLFFNQFYKNNH